MHTAPFDYQRPANLEEAFSLLASEGARPLAGGHSLIPAMKLRVRRHVSSPPLSSWITETLVWVMAVVK